MVSEQEHIEVILEGLTSEYDTFAIALRTRKEEYTVSEIKSLLLAQEVRTNQGTPKTTLSDAMSMNVANMSGKDKLNTAERNTNTNYIINQYNTNQNQRNNYQSNRVGKRGFGRNRGRGRYQGNKGSVVCQVCYKSRHVASHCFQRFDHYFQPSYSSYP